MAQRRVYLAILTLLASLVTFPTSAQTSNFGQMELASGFDRAAATAMGTTGGSIRLGDLAQQLSRGRVPAACQMANLHTSQTPDHLLILHPDLETLRLVVNNGGKTAVLMVQGPDGQIHCSLPGERFNEDAVLQEVDWTAGNYQLWVAAEKAGQQYRLSARE